jgi:16S rRNA (cytosine1402-N4)-methyltransferase
MTATMSYHNPVLLKESVDLMAIKSAGVYVDVTFGGGGHSQEILNRLGPDGKLFAFDQDPDAKNNIPQDPRFTLISSNFRYLQKMLRMHGVTSVDAILGDFGISSHQIDEGERGFSLRYDAALDMRMNRNKGRSAAEVLNQTDETELTRILKQYGEIPRPHLAAKAIIQQQPLASTFELKEAVQKLAPRHKPGQYIAQVFQAIRIEVNEELKVIEELMEQSHAVLKNQGRLVCISYHSLEDRIVKNYFRGGHFDGTMEKDFYGNLIRPFLPITRKPTIPSDEEISANPRARSAKMRAAEKIEKAHD